MEGAQQGTCPARDYCHRKVFSSLQGALCSAPSGLAKLEALRGRSWRGWTVLRSSNLTYCQQTFRCCPRWKQPCSSTPAKIHWACKIARYRIQCCIEGQRSAPFQCTCRDQANLRQGSLSESSCAVNPLYGKPEGITQRHCATALLRWGGQLTCASRSNPRFWDGRRVTASNCGPALAPLYGRT